MIHTADWSDGLNSRALISFSLILELKHAFIMGSNTALLIQPANPEQNVYHKFESVDLFSQQLAYSYTQEFL